MASNTWDLLDHYAKTLKIRLYSEPLCQKPAPAVLSDALKNQFGQNADAHRVQNEPDGCTRKQTFRVCQGKVEPDFPEKTNENKEF
ncbi:hypothetical protein [Rhizobium sp.]|uniref:hypothetical protein n=1 Tax=Rhizobium sp. TaxID=391 RepID=UPI002AA897A3